MSIALVSAWTLAFVGTSTTAHAQAFAPAPVSITPPTGAPPSPAAVVAPAPASAGLAPSGSPAASYGREAVVQDEGNGLYEHDVTWDLNIEGGAGAAFGDASRAVGFGRVRGGVMWIHEPWYSSAGVFYDFSSFTPATFGVQLEQMQLSSGLWVQLGAGVDVQPRPMAMAALGWSLFGVEVQYRDFGSVRDVNTGFAVYGTLRLPVSVIARALERHHFPSPHSTASLAP